MKSKRLFIYSFIYLFINATFIPMSETSKAIHVTLLLEIKIVRHTLTICVEIL